ncbi:MAG: hypothetical protein SOR57_01320 [Parabacteroides sp.]|nr:hypothetical protein [Parabacteroides sp.]
MKIITSKDIKENISLSCLIDEMAKAFILLEGNKSYMPLRTITDMGKDNPILFFKPAIDNTNGYITIKLLNQLKGSSPFGYPTIQGMVILLDGLKNRILSIMDGSIITTYRTGATSGLATKLLSKEDSSVLAIFGAGAQAYTQIEAVMAVRNIKKVIVFDINKNSALKLIEYFKTRKDAEFIEGTDRKTLSEADIICTVTNSTKALFQTNELKEGVHINAIGSFAESMRELPDDVFNGSALYVDHKDSCFKESGDIIVPLKNNRIDNSNFRGEMKDLIKGCIPGRKDEKERTIFKSVGIANQDLVAAEYIYNMSLDKGFGTDIDF